MTKYFVGIVMPVDIETRIYDLQKRMTERARTRYGYQHDISHGKSRPHVTLLEPVAGPPELIHKAVQMTAREQGPFRASFSGLGLFPPHTVYLSCEQGSAQFQRMRTNILSFMGKETSDKVFHVSVARHIEQKDFPSVVATAEEESSMFRSLMNATFVIHGVFIFSKHTPGGRWFPYSYYGLTGPLAS